MNPTIELMNARTSTRAFAPVPITAEEREAVLHTAMRAPTGGNMENGEAVAELLELPPHTFPVAMLVFGRPAKKRSATPHYMQHVVDTDTYHRLTEAELAEVSEELAAMHAPHGLKPGVGNFAQDVYRRKFASDFMCEMNRSVAWWLERWQRPL